jgi:hypothetical protein
MVPRSFSLIFPTRRRHSRASSRAVARRGEDGWGPMGECLQQRRSETAQHPPSVGPRRVDSHAAGGTTRTTPQMSRFQRPKLEWIGVGSGRAVRGAARQRDPGAGRPNAAIRSWRWTADHVGTLQETTITPASHFLARSSARGVPAQAMDRYQGDGATTTPRPRWNTPTTIPSRRPSTRGRRRTSWRTISRTRRCHPTSWNGSVRSSRKRSDARTTRLTDASTRR